LFNLLTSSFAKVRALKSSVDLVYKEFNDVILDSTPKQAELTSSLPFAKYIEMKNISYSYGKNEKIIENLNLKILKGEKIGIMGDSGSGKSTFVNLFCGLLYPTKGEIIVDENNIVKNIKGWQSHISYVSQNNFLLDDTIKNNIIFGKKENEIVDENRIQNILKILNLYNFVNRLELGIDTIVGQYGSLISGGQKQRIGIARAIYSNREIIILDEATSNLDMTNENHILDFLFNSHEMKNKTIIIISHKKNSFQFLKKVYKIKEKKIFINS